MIVWIASFPRSGNTLCRFALERCLGIRTYTDLQFYFTQPPGPPTVPWEERSLGKLGLPEPPVCSVDELERAAELSALKTHSQHRPTSAPAIYLVRDGRDALVSYAHYIQRVLCKLSADAVTPEMIGESIRNLLLDPDPDYGSWSDNVDAWTARPDVAVVSFEHLAADPVTATTDALTKLGLPCKRTDADLPSFDKMRSAAPEFFRSGRVGQWKSEFPSELLPLFWELHGKTMQQLGYADSPDGEQE